MQELLRWITILLLSVIVGLPISVGGWICDEFLRRRRQARRAARVAQYQRMRHEPTEDNRSVTVDELVARVEAEGGPLRLNWYDAGEGKALEGGEDNETD